MLTKFRSVLRYLPIIIALTLAGSVSASGSEADKFFDQTLGDFRSELASAKNSGKTGLLLMFEAEGCPYCLKMRETVLSQPEVQKYFRQHFLIFSVDMLGDIEIQDTAGRSWREKAFAQELRVRGTPTFVFIGTDGNLLARYSGATKSAAEFMQLGHFVVDGIYKTRSFPDYRQSAR